MREPSILVVGETPSLGRAIIDLLDSDGISSTYAAGEAALDLAPRGRGGYGIVIAACNAPYCATARRWAAGRLPGTQLVLVGGRDGSLPTGTGVHVVPLPLPPRQFLRLIHSLVEEGARAPPSRTEPGRRTPKPEPKRPRRRSVRRTVAGAPSPPGAAAPPGEAAEEW